MGAGLQIIWPGNPLPMRNLPSNVEKQPGIHDVITHDSLYWLQEPDAVEKETQTGKRSNQRVRGLN